MAPSHPLRTLGALAATSLLVSVPLLSGCNRGGTTEAGAGSGGASGAAPADAGGLRKDVAPKVLVTPLVQREMVRRISTTTVVESEREIELFPRIGGQYAEYTESQLKAFRDGARALMPRPVPIDSLLAGLARPGRALTDDHDPGARRSDHLGRVARQLHRRQVVRVGVRGRA